MTTTARHATSRYTELAVVQRIINDHTEFSTQNEVVPQDIHGRTTKSAAVAEQGTPSRTTPLAGRSRRHGGGPTDWRGLRC